MKKHISSSSLLMERYVRYRDTLTDLEIQHAEELLSRSIQLKEWKDWLEIFYQIKEEEFRKSDRLILKKIRLFEHTEKTGIEENDSSVKAIWTYAAKENNLGESYRFYKTLISEDQQILLRLFYNENSGLFKCFFIGDESVYRYKRIALCNENWQNPIYFNENGELLIERELMESNNSGIQIQFEMFELE